MILSNLLINILIIILISVLFIRNFLAYLQSENYDFKFGIKRYFLTRKKKYFIINSINFCSIVFLLFLNLLKNDLFILIANNIFLLLLIINIMFIKNKHKLVFTNRIKRIIIILCLINVLSLGIFSWLVLKFNMMLCGLFGFLLENVLLLIVIN